MLLSSSMTLITAITRCWWRSLLHHHTWTPLWNLMIINCLNKLKLQAFGINQSAWLQIQACARHMTPNSGSSSETPARSKRNSNHNTRLESPRGSTWIHRVSQSGRRNTITSSVSGEHPGWFLAIWTHFLLAKDGMMEASSSSTVATPLMYCVWSD